MKRLSWPCWISDHQPARSYAERRGETGVEVPCPLMPVRTSSVSFSLTCTAAPAQGTERWLGSTVLGYEKRCDLSCNSNSTSWVVPNKSSILHG